MFAKNLNYSKILVWFTLVYSALFETSLVYNIVCVTGLPLPVGHTFLCVAICWIMWESVQIWWWLMNTMAIKFSPYVNGYCYTCLFQERCRINAINRLGATPYWSDVRRIHGVDVQGRYTYVKQPRSRIAHVKRADKGYTVNELDSRLSDYRCGYQSALPLPLYHLILSLHQYVRVGFWFMVVISGGAELTVFMIGLGIGAVIAKLDVGVVLVAGLATLMQGLEPFERILLLLMWLGIEKSSGHISLSYFKANWCRSNLELPPDPLFFPTGVAPSMRNTVYEWHDRNPHYEQAVFREDGGVIGEDRETFMDQTGLVNTETRKSGNPHRVPAQNARYLKWFATNELDLATELMLNIGGTFKGWPCTVAGVGIQPQFGDSDEANRLRYPSAPGLGQLIVDDWIPTDCGPVGGGCESWNCNFNVHGIGGAIVCMIHCYDIPVKALIGTARTNNSETCYVVMHASPAVFKDTEGCLPTTEQRWRHNKDGTTSWHWKNTSGRTWSHNTRLYFEHFFTDFIQTDESTWYVSDIHRQIGDLYLIRWTRTGERPPRTKMRQLTIELPHGLTYVPMCDIKSRGLTNITTVEFMPTLKGFEEYVHESKTLDRLMVNLRALTENYARQKGIKIPFPTHDTLLSIWHAECHRRKLIESADSSKNKMFNLKALFGLESDPRVVSRLSTEVLKLLKRQPATSVILPTIAQETAFMVGTIHEVVKRETPFIKLQGGSSKLYEQSRLDEKRPVSTVELHGKGAFVFEQLCHCLFARVTSIGPILPCGNDWQGGSVLVNENYMLLNTELEYLIQDSNVVLLIDFLNTDAGIIEKCAFIGNTNQEIRKVVVKIAKDDIHKPYRVKRIHYTPKTDIQHLIARQGYEFRDLCDYQDELNEIRQRDIVNGGPAVGRTYVKCPQGVEKWQIKRDKALNDRIKKTTNITTLEDLKRCLRNLPVDDGLPPEQRQGLMAEGRLYGPFTYDQLTFDLPDNANYAQIPIIENNDPWCMQYDGNEWINECKYLPAHYYYDRTIEEMRGLMKK